ncbi:DUF7344 domain-containing protein [Halobacterium rubrum]|uniref:DUF7344 domain-containing protein n=1 Tax=Halobacterium TaxID=2239 RepID=UPI001F38AF09|nr:MULTISPECIES: hypothetical protein [Halobacterium]MDH5018909.1 hypothetical protein [Halobacterium rubrum]
MSHHQSLTPEVPTDHYALLADPLRRRVLSHIQYSTTEETSLEALAGELRTAEDVDADALAIRLHHVVLPQLADAGVVKYDARNKTVRYRDHAVLDRLDVAPRSGCCSPGGRERRRAR